MAVASSAETAIMAATSNYLKRRLLFLRNCFSWEFQLIVAHLNLLPNCHVLIKRKEILVNNLVK